MPDRQSNAFGFTAIGSFLSAIGTGAAFSALFWVLSAISFSGPQPPPVQEALQVGLVYALISGLGVAAVFGVAQGLKHLFGGGAKIGAGISQILAALAGLCLGTGVLFWMTIAVSEFDNSSSGALVALLLSPLISSLIAYTSWTRFSNFGSPEGVAEQQILSRSLARTSAIATIVPVLYLIFVAL